MRDERAAPFFCYLVRHLDRRALPQVYIAAIEALGTFGGADAVDALKFALHQGEWWAPLRTRRLACRGRRRPAQDRHAGRLDALAAPPPRRAARRARGRARRARARLTVGSETRNRGRISRCPTCRRRVAQYDELLRRFASGVRAAQLYAPDHPLVGRNIEGLLAVLKSAARRPALHRHRHRRHAARRRPTRRCRRPASGWSSSSSG